MLKAQVIGNVGRDPDIEHKNDYSFARFSLASNRKVKGEKQTTWINVVVFGDKRVEFIQGYVKKGAKLFIEGDVQAHYYKTRNGEDAASLDVIVGSFDGKLELVSSEPPDENQRDEGYDDRRQTKTREPERSRGDWIPGRDERQRHQSNQRSQPNAPSSAQWDAEFDDDIPF